MKASSFLTQIRPGYFRLSIHAKPGARHSSLVSQVSGEALEIRLAAPPVEGKANIELLEFLQEFIESKHKEFITLINNNKNNVNSNSDIDYTYNKYNKKIKEKGKKNKEEMESGRKEELPDKVRVSLISGATARHKVVEVAFPGTEEELLHLLQSVDNS